MNWTLQLSSKKNVSQQNKDTENIINCKYYNIEKLESLNNLNCKNALNLFHINTFFPKNIEGLEYLLDNTKIDFDVIGISESRIKKGKSPMNSINLKDYSYESCPTESAAAGTLLYIINRLLNKPKNVLCIYKSTELEQTLLKF